MDKPTTQLDPKQVAAILKKPIEEMTIEDSIRLSATNLIAGSKHFLQIETSIAEMKTTLAEMKAFMEEFKQYFPITEQYSFDDDDEDEEKED